MRPLSSRFTFFSLVLSTFILSIQTSASASTLPTHPPLCPATTSIRDVKPICVPTSISEASTPASTTPPSLEETPFLTAFIPLQMRSDASPTDVTGFEVTFEEFAGPPSGCSAISCVETCIQGANGTATTTSSNVNHVDEASSIDSVGDGASDSHVGADVGLDKAKKPTNTQAVIDFIPPSLALLAVVLTVAYGYNHALNGLKILMRGVAAGAAYFLHLFSDAADAVRLLIPARRRVEPSRLDARALYQILPEGVYAIPGRTVVEPAGYIVAPAHMMEEP
ncbi:hypothetical protein OF83DRAFT_1167856 [Amylostereum chailletii]|nr:hypothetical protein OF83DRAFT_1167856 [Amylostereum chailletii]